MLRRGLAVEPIRPADVLGALRLPPRAAGMTAGTAGAGFAAVRTVGTLLPADLLARVAAGGDLPGLRSEDYHLAGESLREAACAGV